MINESQTPLPLVRQWTDKVPNIWETLADIAEDIRQGDDLELARESELTAALNLIDALMPPQSGIEQAEKAQAAFNLYCCAVWRQHKVVYAFDPTLAAELIQQADEWDDANVLPVEVLKHPPYQCCFISAPGAIDPEFIGFFPPVVQDITGNGPVLALTSVYKDANGEFSTHTEPIHLSGSTVGDCVDHTSRAARRVLHNAKDEMNFNRETNFRLLNLYLYICAANAEVASAPAPTYRQRTTGSPIRDRYREVQSYDTGVVIGAALRKASASRSASTGRGEPTGRHVRAHTRRGHWHHFWTGKRDIPEERKIVLKWVSPVLVGGKDEPEATTIHPVKQ